VSTDPGRPAGSSGTAQSRGTDPRLPELAGMLREVTGEGPRWAERIGPDSRLEDDLQLESLELAALGDLLKRRYGSGVDLVGYLAGLDLDQLIAVTVGDLLALLPAAAAGPPSLVP
jgi:acyl carrier protein